MCQCQKFFWWILFKKWLHGKCNSIGNFVWVFTIHVFKIKIFSLLDFITIESDFFLKEKPLNGTLLLKRMMILWFLPYRVLSLKKTCVVSGSCQKVSEVQRDLLSPLCSIPWMSHFEKKYPCHFKNSIQNWVTYLIKKSCFFLKIRMFLNLKILGVLGN